MRNVLLTDVLQRLKRFISNPTITIMKKRINIKRYTGISILLLVFIATFYPAVTNGQSRIGISAMGGAGLFVAADKDYYGGISTDIYPEIGGQLDISIIRLGLKIGYIYREVQFSYYAYSGHYYYNEYTLAYAPVQLEFLIAPLSTTKDYMFSPYFGLMAGAFIATGDNDDTLPAISIKMGGEVNLEPLLMYGDIRYTYASDDSWGNNTNVGGFMLVAGLGIRLGVSK